MTTSKDFISTGDGVFFRHFDLSLFILCYSYLFLPSFVSSSGVFSSHLCEKKKIKKEKEKKNLSPFVI